MLAARDEELAAVKSVLAARDQELAAVKPVLAARDEELAAIKPVLAARDKEIADLEESRQQQREQIRAVSARLVAAESMLGRLRKSRLGRLALWITREK